MEAEMTVQDLAKIVTRMRVSQQVYFHMRSQEHLNRAKELEREVDALCRKLLKNQPELL